MGGTAGADTTADFRYGDPTTFNNIRLALPTGMPTGDTPGTFREANAQGNQRSDLTAIWDQFNTNYSTGQTYNTNPVTASSTATGWASNDYWSATSTGSNSHVIVGTFSGAVYGGADTTNNYAALQVL
jgi:hypothetical protein